MILKGLPFYDITDVDGELMVWSLRQKKWLKRTYNPHAGYRLRLDNRLLFFSDGHLRFLMKHPDLHAATVSPKSDRITFNEDGAVRNYHSGEDRERPYKTFKSLDDALNTILLLMSVSEGNDIPIAHFVAEHRNEACVIVARMMWSTPLQVSYHLEDGERLFYQELMTLRVERIQPLFAWLCKCIKVAMIRAKRKMSTDSPGILDRLISQEL